MTHLQTKINELTVAKDYFERGMAVLKIANDPHAFEAETVIMSLRSKITDMQTFPEDYTLTVVKCQ